MHNVCPQAEQQGEEADGEAHGTNVHDGTGMSAAQRSLALQQLPEDTVAPARAAVDALSGADAQVTAQ